jgi:hypothetical protein
MECHLKTLGLVHVAYGVLGVATSYGISLLSARLGLLCSQIRGDFYAGNHVFYGGHGLIDLIGLHLMGLVALLSLGSIIAGCGLIGHKNWARNLALILGIIALFNLPFGTALGVYTIWVVTRSETKELTAS